MQPTLMLKNACIQTPTMGNYSFLCNATLYEHISIYGTKQLHMCVFIVFNIHLYIYINVCVNVCLL